MIEIVRPLLASFWSFNVQLVFCHYGQTVTDRFEEIVNALGGNDWYTFPIEIQRMLPIIINVSQKPVLISGFGNLLYTHESFKKVSVVGKFCDERFCTGAIEDR